MSQTEATLPTVQTAGKGSQSPPTTTAPAASGMSENNPILSVVVGSRLHGLNKPDSDYDVRGIFMNPLKRILSPYQKVKTTSWIEGDEDNTAYELADFCKYATQGNATILEILYSDMIREKTPLGQVLIDNRTKFLDSTRIFEAHKGYAHNQYNKMNLFEPDVRTPKFAVAYMRVLLQAIQMLQHGNYALWLNPQDKEFLLDVKYNFSPVYHVPKLSARFAGLQVLLQDVYYKYKDRYKPDFEWIEDFIYDAYLDQELPPDWRMKFSDTKALDLRPDA